jgi:hypothetical protein
VVVTYGLRRGRRRARVRRRPGRAWPAALDLAHGERAEPLDEGDLVLLGRHRLERPRPELVGAHPLVGQYGALAVAGARRTPGAGGEPGQRQRQRHEDHHRRQRRERRRVRGGVQPAVDLALDPVEELLEQVAVVVLGAEQLAAQL